MIIYLYGPDSYRRNLKLREIVKFYRKKHREADIISIDLSDNDSDWIKIRDFLTQPSMFVDSKIALVKESGSIEEKDWIEGLKNQIKTEKTFVIISDCDEPKKEFNFLLKSPVQFQFFGELEDRLLDTFLKKEADSKNLVFSEDALRFFVNYIKSSSDRSWHIVNELEKISLANFKNPITLQILQLIIDWAATYEVFRIAREITACKTTKERLRFLERAFLQGVSPAYMFNSLGFQARAETLLRLADYDVAIKSGKIDYKEALFDFAIKL
ncbi:MAG: hypothetical protein QMD65_02630 [Patescibacteria group bacterium]|nr:hypothetical protein [Patescibacteria group bacterium]